MRIVFFGSSDFGIPALRLLAARHQVVGVVSTPPRAGGRGLKLGESPVVTVARSEVSVPILTPDSLQDQLFINTLTSFKADCFIVVAFRLLPGSVFSIPRLGTLNIHASLLPAFRGPAPIQRAIEAGAPRSGVTVFRIDEGIDTGEILRQAAVEIGAEETAPELYRRLSCLGAETLNMVLDELSMGTCTPVIQQHEDATRAPKLKKSEALIDWNRSASILFNKIRAFKPFPGTYTLFDGRRLGIEWACPLLEDGGSFPVGTVVNIDADFFDVQTGSGILRVLSVKPEGRRLMSASDYLNGSPLRKGMRLNG